MKPKQSLFRTAIVALAPTAAAASGVARAHDHVHRPRINRQVKEN